MDLFVVEREAYGSRHVKTWVATCQGTPTCTSVGGKVGFAHCRVKSGLLKGFVPGTSRSLKENNLFYRPELF